MDDETRERLIEAVFNHEENGERRLVEGKSAWAGSVQLDQAHKAGMGFYTILGRAYSEAEKQGADRKKLNAIRDVRQQAQSLYQRIAKIVMMD